jgi:adenosine deaminase
VKLKVFDSIEEHNINKLLDLGLCVTVNSDDPAYFGGYLVENFLAIQKGLNLTDSDLIKLVDNGFKAGASHFCNEQ